MTSGQLFWIIKNGIRMSGMASYGKIHNDDEIWNVAAFVQRLPKMTPEEYRRLERRPRIDALKLKRENDALAFQLLRVREELRNKEGYVIGLEIVLHERLERIDKLTAQIDQLREQNKRLDEEAERLVEMIRLAPPGDTATAAPK